MATAACLFKSSVTIQISNPWTLGCLACTEDYFMEPTRSPVQRSWIRL